MAVGDCFCTDELVAVLHRIESALQQNEIMDVFFDDWAALTVDDGSFGSKADNHLKVPVYLVQYYSVLRLFQRSASVVKRYCPVCLTFR